MSIKSTVLFTGSVMEYWRTYFSNRRFPENQEYYIVYTNLDHAIPFHPDAALNYWMINFKFVPTATRLGDTLPAERFSEIRHTYLEIVSQGVAVFRAVPTVMPHFAGNNSRSPLQAWSFLKPINCSPSLHTAAPFFIYNLGAKYFPEQESELRRHIGDIVSTVIRSKYHAMIDIAFGMFLCRRIIEEKLGIEFHPLETFFLQEQSARDKIPYEHVFRLYREINDIAKTNSNAANLSELMESYFKQIGLPRVRQEKSNCFYDLDEKTLVYPPELKVGRGVF